MRSVYRSIKPYWLYLILIGKKTIEVGKNFPKADDWNKDVFLYCSKDMKSFNRIPEKDREWMRKYLGKVACRFVCDKIETLTERDLFEGMDEISNSRIEEYSCVSIDELLQYKGSKNEIYGWHISDLKIYDKPRDLSEFYAEGDCDYKNCSQCVRLKFVSASKANCELEEGYKPITRPPQSWCYVEEQE